MDAKFSFEIKNIRDFHLKLQWEFNRLIKEEHSTDHAINFSFTAHHLYNDWLRKSDNTEFNKIKKIYEKDFKNEFEIIKGICEGSKHLIRQEGKSTIVDHSYENEGTFDYTFDSSFDKHELVVITNDKSRFDFFEVAQRVVNFWNHYFQQDDIKQ